MYIWGVDSDNETNLNLNQSDKLPEELESGRSPVCQVNTGTTPIRHITSTVP